MSEFSIGPWQATTTPAGKGKVVDKNGFSVANATATPWTQGLADARLIAAAPDLLDQHEADLTDLDLLAKAIHVGDPMAELVIRITDILNRKRALIRRATGAAE